MPAMRANNLRAPIGVVLGFGLALTACGPIAFQDSINFATAKKPEPVAVEVKPKRAQISGDQIVLDGKIQFDYNSATIKPESHGLLDDVVGILTDNPDIELLDIVGHTSSEGSDSVNLKLSKERAASVMQYLVDKGIDAARLKSQGKGEKEPIADNETDEGKEKNRRVEFNIEKRGAARSEGESEGGARGRPGATII
jgi:outer membrane protein OmpA-like peptidoglycan-associated protein